MTNPNDAVGTNAAYGGRTSANAFNDNLAMSSTGIVSGWACAPDSGMTVSLGGDGTTRDVAIAQDNAGNKTTINNISGLPINVTLDAAPGSNSRIDLVVAYVDNPPQGVSTVADNPSACGIINVTGTPASTPIAPNDSAIRTAITGDGASGTTAYYVVLARITVTSSTTDITSGDIVAGASAVVNNDQLPLIAGNKLDYSTLNFGNYSTSEVDTGFTWIDGKKIYKKTIDCGYLPNNTGKAVQHSISNLDKIIKIETVARNATTTATHMMDSVFYNTSGYLEVVYVTDTVVQLNTNTDRTAWYCYVTIYYTKSSQ